jgi:hypothetical protein
MESVLVLAPLYSTMVAEKAGVRVRASRSRERMAFLL